MSLTDRRISCRKFLKGVAAFFATIPALILVFVAQMHIVKGMTLGALKG